MSYIINTLRNNWKKTIFFTIAGYYGADTILYRYQSFDLMKGLCLEALTSGEKPLPFGSKSRHITLLLNPIAGNRKGKDNFEKFAEPLMHLSGFLVSIVKTEKIAEARDLVGLIENTNIIAVAGGDGTLMEVVTGLLRRSDADEAVEKFPIAVIPIGTHNSFAKSSGHFYSDTEKAAAIAQSAIDITRHRLEPKDVIKVELIQKDESTKVDEITTINEEQVEATTNELKNTETLDSIPEEIKDTVKKPYYSMRGVELGQFREAEKREDNLPSLLNSRLRTFWSLLRTPNVECKAELRYLPHCNGCSRCKDEKLKKLRPKQSFSIMSRIFSAIRPAVYASENWKLDPTDPKWNSTNPFCGNWESLCVDSAELNVIAQGDGKLEIQIGNHYSRLSFIREGFRRKYKGIYDFNRRIPCSEIQIFPITTPENYSIDHEDFPVEPIQMQVLKHKVYFFCSTKENQSFMKN